MGLSTALIRYLIFYFDVLAAFLVIPVCKQCEVGNRDMLIYFQQHCDTTSLVNLKTGYKRAFPWLAPEHWWKLRHSAVMGFGPTGLFKSSCAPLCAGVLTKGAQGFKDACASFVPLSPPLNCVLNSVKTSQCPRRAWGGPLCVSPGRCLDRLAHCGHISKTLGGTTFCCLGSCCV